MTVKYIHRGITLYVSCTINSSWIQGRSAADQYGLQHSIAAVPRASHGSWDLPGASLSASCQTGAQVSKAKRAVFWNAGYVLSACWTFHLFFNTSVRNSFALLFPTHRWLSIIAWCEHFQYSCLLVAKCSSRGRENRLTLVAVSLCLHFSAEWGNDDAFFFFPFFATLCFVATLCREEMNSSWFFSLLPPVGCNAAKPETVSKLMGKGMYWQAGVVCTKHK